MKINKVIFGLTVMMAAFFTSCSQDNDGAVYTPTFEHVSFEKASTSVTVSVDESSATIPVTITRGLGTEPSTFTFTAEASEDGIFSNEVNNTVTFAAGQNTVTFNVTASNLEKEVSYTYTLTLSDAAIMTADTIINGAKQNTVFTIKVTREGDWTTWEPLGWDYPSSVTTFAEWEEAYAEFAEDWEDYDLIASGGEEGLPTYTYVQYMSGTYSQPVFVRTSMLNPDNAQLMLYDWFYGVNLIINWDKEANILSVDGQWTGYVNANYGDVYAADAFTYFNDDKDKDGKELTPCTYDEENGLFTLDMIYYVNVGYFGHGPEYIQLPGYEKLDYSLSIVDNGAFQNGSQLGEVFDFTLGENLGKIQFAVFEGVLTEEEIAAKVEGISTEEIASTTTTESGYKVVMVSDEGDYTLVAVLYDAEGNQVGSESLSFTVTRPVAAKTWTAIYTGDYLYTQLFNEPVSDDGLTLYQCNETPDLFKIENWGGDVDFLFTFDGDGNILVSDQPSGFEHSTYGMIMVDDLVDYTGSTNYGYSYYDQEAVTFNFAVIYYVSGGVFGYGYETFTLTGSAAVAANKVLAKARQRVMASAKDVTFSKATLKLNDDLKINKNIKSAKTTYRKENLKSFNKREIPFKEIHVTK